jgi:hypothetical protein
LSGNDTTTRDMVLSQPGLSEAVAFTVSQASLLTSQSETGLEGELIKLSAWLISNLCRGSPPCAFAEVRVFLPALASLFSVQHERLASIAASNSSSSSSGGGGDDEDDEDGGTDVMSQSVVEACWACLFILKANKESFQTDPPPSDDDSLNSTTQATNGSNNECVEEFIVSGLIENLISLLQAETKWNNPGVITIPGLRALGYLLEVASPEQYMVSFSICIKI